MREAPILIVDDDPDVRDSLRVFLESAGFGVCQYGSAKPILADAGIGQGVCVTTEIRMPETHGLELQEAQKKRGVGLPVIIVTGHGDISPAPYD